MFVRNRSGQFLYFALAGVASGLPITSGATVISGRRSIDGGAQSLVSGTFTEIGGGQYVFNMYAEDVNGLNIGYLFTSSGAALFNASVVTLANVSGQVFGASGVFASVLPVSLSGVVVNSGLFVTVPIATISGTVVNSGLFVSVPIATISGVRPISGTFASVPIASISGVTANSGLFVSVPIATISGVQPISGTTVSVPIATLSGVQPISGTFVSLVSGTLYPASGVIGKSVMQWNFSGQANVSGQPNLQNAARKLVTSFDLTTSGYLTVYQEDGVTLAYRQAVTTISGALPIEALATQ